MCKVVLTNQFTKINRRLKTKEINYTDHLVNLDSPKYKALMYYVGSYYNIKFIVLK